MDKLFCFRLKEVRLEKGLTQLKLAKLLNFSVTKISKLENCLMPIALKDLNDLSSILNVNSQYIIGKDNSKPVYEKKYGEFDEEFEREFAYVTLD
ncbi:MAG: helix-turn-helix transcriptional regulator [Clostridia bacterium]|nr:helix-turn-helix transcriptional regulator [Clostridia bacterium]